MQNNDINKLRYWQKRYRQESMWVVLLLLTVVALVVLFVSAAEIGWLIVILALVIAYLMVKALKEDLQTRAEVLIFEKNKAIFGDVVFDVGGGEATEVLLAQNVIESRQARECHNVMKSADYMWEEDVFYVEQKFKWFSIRNTAFKGVILSVKAPKAPKNAMADVRFKDMKVEISGELKGYLERHKAVPMLEKIFRLFGVYRMRAAVYNGKIYFWFMDAGKLFYQFSLIKIISPLLFIGRVQQLKQYADNLVDVLKF